MRLVNDDLAGRRHVGSFSYGVVGSIDHSCECWTEIHQKNKIFVQTESANTKLSSSSLAVVNSLLSTGTDARNISRSVAEFVKVFFPLFTLSASQH